jgi:hypothetical protein
VFGDFHDTLAQERRIPFDGDGMVIDNAENAVIFICKAGRWEEHQVVAQMQITEGLLPEKMVGLSESS